MKCQIAFALLWSLAAQCLAATPFALPVTQDNSVVLVDGEWKLNAGSQGRMRIKGNQHIVVMSFDTSAIRGRRVTKATLVCSQGAKEISGVSISTIASPWNERRSCGVTSGAAPFTGWGYPGGKLPAVIGGNAFTMVHACDTRLIDGSYHWDVPVDMVHAMAIDAAYGLAIHEHEADYTRNPTIFSREQSAKRPYLMVEVEDDDGTVPLPPSQLQVTQMDRESALFSLVAPQHGFAYEVTIDQTPLARHNIPWIEHGSQQFIHLRDLPLPITDDSTHEISVVAVSRTGHRSQPAKVQSQIFQTLPIDTPRVMTRPRQTPVVQGVGVIPITDKFDAEGKPIGELPDDYRINNSLFDGQQVHLIAAAGEVIGFQVLLRGQGHVGVDVSMAGPLARARIDLSQSVYVPTDGRMIPDPLLPLDDTIELHPQQDQVVVADLFIPFDCVAGLHLGEITISDGRKIPIEIEVMPFALPKTASFACEMNGYGLPDSVDQYNELQYIAYDHRVHANILHYSHHTAAPGARKSNLDMRLKSGKRMDNRRYDNIPPGSTHGYWDDFAEAFGPYLDGTLFQDGHRGPIPAPGFYLTFHESWPLNCRAYFNGNPDAFEAFSEHPEYSQTFVNMLRDFETLATKQDWTKTGFQIYFNNKGSLNEATKAPWIFDEPSSFWDYRALGYFGQLSDQGRLNNDTVKIDFRIDLSRPEFCRGQLDGRSDLWIVSSWAFQNYRRLVTDRMKSDSVETWIYGTTNHVHQSNRNTVAWALDAWQHGATGVVPWQTINKSGDAMARADQLGLFIFDQDESGNTTIRHSIRLKAYREAQQLIEYLNLLKVKRGWSRDQMQRFVRTYVKFDADVAKTNVADAGTSTYREVSPTSLETLRLATAKLLAP
ncbi:hypothetical protein Pla22_00910 [Rubripirellula amarantea]|uniref:Glycoside hydrolase 123 C-terminal domain-containing protein n=1 Tax=Rubripirellula amarantea TaxID=2527999 RepID=A0A5C5WPG7_9BACT|nr:hypothetical protein [Rubripirellula amarantea]TWT52467.1 hypothetical protein Pla22_00910 [Rubripirellula amarantea]